ncbi:MAG TPA: hypothetical protein VMM13_14015 [Euzebya sp.]|nr:hypothetical protein [Euzebya sp.]
MQEASVRVARIVAAVLVIALATACDGEEAQSATAITTQPPAATEAPTQRGTLSSASEDPRALSSQVPTATATPKPVPTTQEPAPPQPPTLEPTPSPTDQVDACAVLTEALDAVLGGAPEEPSGDGANCFIFAEDPVAFFLSPAADFEIQAAADRPAAGEPVEGLGDQALYYDGETAGGASAVLVQTGDHTFLLTIAGVDRDTLLAVSQAVSDILH